MTLNDLYNGTTKFMATAMNQLAGRPGHSNQWLPAKSGWLDIPLLGLPQILSGLRSMIYRSRAYLYNLMAPDQAALSQSLLEMLSHVAASDQTALGQQSLFEILGRDVILAIINIMLAPFTIAHIAASIAINALHAVKIVAAAALTLVATPFYMLGSIGYHFLYKSRSNDGSPSPQPSSNEKNDNKFDFEQLHLGQPRNLYRKRHFDGSRNSDSYSYSDSYSNSNSYSDSDSDDELSETNTATNATTRSGIVLQNMFNERAKKSVSFAQQLEQEAPASLKR